MSKITKAVAALLALAACLLVAWREIVVHNHRLAHVVLRYEVGRGTDPRVAQVKVADIDSACIWINVWRAATHEDRAADDQQGQVLTEMERVYEGRFGKSCPDLALGEERDGA